MNKALTIGRVAQAAEVNIETIRYYQRIGLIAVPDKPLEGYRIYPADVIARLHFIKRAQRLGFSLQEVAELLQLDNGQCDDVRSRAEQKRAQIDRQISDLKNLRKTLNTLIKTCQSDRDTKHCPIIDTLTG